MPKQMRIFAACGNLGYGFPEENLKRALEMDLSFLGSDAGSTDCGPYYLGEGVPFVSREAFKRDATLLLKAALDKKYLYCLAHALEAEMTIVLISQ